MKANETWDEKKSAEIATKQIKYSKQTNQTYIQCFFFVLSFSLFPSYKINICLKNDESDKIEALT